MPSFNPWASQKQAKIEHYIVNVGHMKTLYQNVKYVNMAMARAGIFFI
jgi:hypothetical protein